MKKIAILIAAVLMIGSGNVFAQKKEVSKAKAKLNSETPDYKAAKDLITPALTDPETKDLADTWFTAGKINYKIFDGEQRKEWLGQKVDSKLMAESLMACYDYLVKADEIEQTPHLDKKGNMVTDKPKFRKEITEIAGAMQNGFINAGAYYFREAGNASDNEQVASELYHKAIDCFEKYLSYPELKFWDAEKAAALKADTLIDDIQYYCGAAASQAGDSKTALKYFKQLLGVYKPEEEMYQFVIYEYGRLEDTVAMMDMYKLCSQKFPQNPFYARSLVNEYLQKNNLDEAMRWIDQAINNGDSTSIFYNLKGQIIEHQAQALSDEAADLKLKAKDLQTEANNLKKAKKNAEAEAKQNESKSLTAQSEAKSAEATKLLGDVEQWFIKAVAQDPESADSNGNLGRIYYNRAVEELDRVNAIKDDKEYRAAKAQMKSVFEKPLKYMEKAHALNPEERDYVVALRGIYYNLGKGYENKYQEMDALMKSM